MNDETFFSYKERPLVRNGNTMYYGSMADSHVVLMQIVSEEQFKDLCLPTKIVMKLMLTDSTKNPMECILKTAEKDSLYDALDVADVWLATAMKEN